MNKQINSKQFLNGIFVVIFILTPLISAVLFCLKDGKVISDIYIPLGGWSDEITYYKQIEGILSHGMPRGYFGYNQSKALYGPLAVWGVVPLIPYVVWGFFFGWNYCSPIYANIFFCIVALTFFYRLLRPKKAEMITIALFWVINLFLNRYILSGVIEASMIAQLMIVMTCGEYLLSKRIRERREEDSSPVKDRVVFILCTVMVCFLTLARPYFAVFFMIPLWKAIKDKNKKWIAMLPFLAIGIIGVFFLNSKYFCSTYFSSVITFEKIKSLKFSGLLESILEMAKLIWYAVRYKGSGPGWYYLLLLLELAGMVCVCIHRRCSREEIPPIFFVALLGDSLIVFSIIVMYSLGVGARHILTLIVVNALLLIIETHFLWGGILSVVCIGAIIQTGGTDALPYKNEEYVQYMNTLENEFAEVVKVTREISYDNVVAMPTADRDIRNPEREVCTYYGILFAMPSGVGISLDYEDFYDNPQNIKARYILVHPEGSIRKILEETGMTCVFSNKELMLYETKVPFS